MTDRTKAMDDLIAQDADLIDQQNAENFARSGNVQTKPGNFDMSDDALVLELTNEIMGRTATVAARAILPLIEADREAVRAEQARAVEVELSMCAIANVEAPSEWIDGFEFAWKRVKAVLEKQDVKG